MTYKFQYLEIGYSRYFFGVDPVLKPKNLCIKMIKSGGNRVIQCLRMENHLPEAERAIVFIAE